MTKRPRSIEDLLGPAPRPNRIGSAGKGTTPTRDRLNAAQARLAELKAFHLEGELLARAAVLAEWSSILREIRAGILAAPSRIRAQLPHLTAHDVAVVDSVLRDVLTDLAGGNGPATAPPEAAETP